MSATLLQRVSDHLALGGLLDGYKIRFFRWTDDNAKEPTALFRLAGTQGALTDFSVQYPDVTLTLIGTRKSAMDDSERCRAIYQYLREHYQFVDYNWEGIYPEGSLLRTTVDETANDGWPDEDTETQTLESDDTSIEPTSEEEDGTPLYVTKLLNIEPLTAVSGPFYLQDGRPWFQMDFRLIVSDH